MSICTGLFAVIILVSTGSLAEFRSKLMPSSHIVQAGKLLADCKNATVMLSVEIDTCEDQVTEVWRETRCRTVNAHIDATTARLNRLESYFAQLETGILNNSLQACSDAVTNTEEALERQHASLMQELHTLNDSLVSLIKDESDLRAEISVLQNRSHSLRCEQQKLQSEIELRKDQLEYQSWTTKVNYNSGVPVETVQELIDGANKDRQKALEDCTLELQKVKQATEHCFINIAFIESELAKFTTTLAFDKHMLRFFDMQAETCVHILSDCHDSMEACSRKLADTRTRHARLNLALLEDRVSLAACSKESAAARIAGTACTESRQQVSRQMLLMRSILPGVRQESVQKCSDELTSCRRQLDVIRDDAETSRSERLECAELEASCNNTLEECTAAKQKSQTNGGAVAESLDKPARELATKLEAERECGRQRLRLQSDISFMNEDVLRADLELASNQQVMAHCLQEKCI